MSDSAPVNDLLLAVASGAIGVIFAAPTGWLKGRSDERAATRKRREDDQLAAIESTEKFVLGAINSLRDRGPDDASRAPDSEIVRLKDERLLTAAMWQSWLENTVKLAPLRGALDGEQNRTVTRLAGEIQAYLRNQRDRVIDGQPPELCTATPAIHALYARAFDLLR